jgi:hypothetical protein
MKTVLPPWHNRWLLLVAGLIPLVVLELAKLLRMGMPSGRSQADLKS